MKWFIVRREGGEREYVTLSRLKTVAPTVPIFGAERGAVRVVYDRILRAKGWPPFWSRNLVTGHERLVAG